ncbi:tRNA (guanine(37)-N1)-methyltransferase Trm5b [Methanocaldococcus indicus]|uniref:tRNA (guanine(37)-N1)-methyltransferase Trm5b n=1 Tax=Methanocaldococcus indicus TaxID=213231 RepID=UPI003C6D2D40
MVKALKVNKKFGESVRRILIENSIYNKEYKIEKDNNYLYIPIYNINEEILQNLINVEFDIVEKDLEKIKKNKQKSFRDVVLEKYSNLVKNKLVSLSYDHIGDLVLLQIDDEVPYNIRKDIGELAYKLIPCRGVFRRKSEIKGEYRVREIEHLAGENRTLTIHKENNYRLYVDIANVYFSPRLGWERKRVGELVKGNEIVIDMFSGVGPFSIACKNAKKIYAIDINPYAIDLLKKNIEMNKLQHKIIPILSDVREVNLKGDRIIMNLPKYSYKFIDKALELVKEGGVIHYYTIGKDFDEAIKPFINKCEFKILNKRIVKSYAPREYIFSFDIKVVKV